MPLVLTAANSFMSQAEIAGNYADFFSNTIMNITLPEAVVAEINRDVITAQITGEGIAEAENLYSIVMSESRVIDSIPVTVGQEIKQGDVICYLQGEESDALADAVSRKEAMELEYNKLVLNNHVTETELQTLLTNGITLQECQAKLSAVQDEQQYDQMLIHLLALMDIYSQYQEIRKQNELIEKYTAASMGTSLASPLDGTIVEIQAVPGKRAEQDSTVSGLGKRGQRLAAAVICSYVYLDSSYSCFSDYDRKEKYHKNSTMGSFHKEILEPLF